MEETMVTTTRTGVKSPDHSEPSKTFSVEPTGETIIIDDFNLSIDILDFSTFIRSDVSEALQNAQGSENAVLNFFDGTEIVISGIGISGETIQQAEIIVSGSNQIPQGTLFVTGLEEVGATLTAEVQNLSDGDGIVGETIQIQWFRDDLPINEALGTTYTVSDADIESTLTARLTYKDLFGRIETISSNVISFEETLDPEEDDPVNSMPPLDTEEDEENADRPTIEDRVNDTPVTATPFQDVFTARGGMNVIDGLEGVDTAVFPGDQNNYVLTLTTTGASVSDKRADGLGTISLENIEIIGFVSHQDEASPRLDLRQVDGYLDLTSEQFEELIEIYIAYFNRAPDAIGLAFWSNAYSDGVPLEDISRMFIDQEETRTAYREENSSIKFVAEVYDNVLGRAPDFEGLMFWKDALDAGTVTRDAFILEILGGVRAETPEGSSQAFIDRQLADQRYLDLKTDLGALYAVHHGMSDINNASQIMAIFDGSVESFSEATDAIETAYNIALASEDGEFLMPLVGVIDSPTVF
jgi:hypothetical protein